LIEIEPPLAPALLRSPVLTSPLVAVRLIAPPVPLSRLESRETPLAFMSVPLRVMLPPLVCTGLETVTVPGLLIVKLPPAVDKELEKV
jgi:hypothetical protein